MAAPLESNDVRLPNICFRHPPKRVIDETIEEFGGSIFCRSIHSTFLRTVCTRACRKSIFAG
jgi:hypothetical protein